MRSGAVTLNGEVIKNSDIKIDEYKDVLAVFGENVEYRPYIYLMLNKPSGYVSAAVDNVYPTVVELAEGYEHYELFPVGRLDVDTEGLLILTNDGKTAHKILSPKKSRAQGILRANKPPGDRWRHSAFGAAHGFGRFYNNAGTGTKRRTAAL